PADEFLNGQREMLDHCQKMGERFALLDSPRGLTATGQGSIQEWTERFRLLPESRNGAVYFPWLEPDPAGRGFSVPADKLVIPACGHVAGIYARCEREGGLGEAPANEILKGVVDLESKIGDAEQEVLNPLGVNCLRVFPGRGIRVWGARTLSQHAAWRYVNVRRLYLGISKYLLTRMQWASFEPHDGRLRARLSRTLKLYFTELFRAGTLAGEQPEEAFFVKCDNETNPPEGVDRGELVARVGFAPLFPSEFVIVTVTRTAESLTVQEEF
ncbi:MAG: phage tail sheath family protein, partial [Acidobacteria bacterium]